MTNEPGPWSGAHGRRTPPVVEYGPALQTKLLSPVALAQEPSAILCAPVAALFWPAVKVPSTSSVTLGVVVPMPTLPPFLTLRRGECDVYRSRPN